MRVWRIAISAIVSCQVIVMPLLVFAYVLKHMPSDSNDVRVGSSRSLMLVGFSWGFYPVWLGLSWRAVAARRRYEWSTPTSWALCCCISLGSRNWLCGRCTNFEGFQVGRCLYARSLWLSGWVLVWMGLWLFSGEALVTMSPTRWRLVSAADLNSKVMMNPPTLALAVRQVVVSLVLVLWSRAAVWFALEMVSFI